LENVNLKKRILKLEEEKDSYEEDSSGIYELKEINAQLSRRVDYLQKREKELLKSIAKYQSNT